MSTIPFSQPRIDQKVIDEVVDTLKSGWVNNGPKTKLFENKITEYCNCKSTLCVSSATAGLELVLRWFGVEKGDEVILPAYTYCATAHTIVHCGATPVFVDVNKDDFNISLKHIEKAITKKTKVIMPVDFAGFPCDYNEINKIVKSDNFKSLFIPLSEIQKKLGRILVLADAAHAFGAEYFGKKAGALTDVTVFSFHTVKNIITVEGGAICFNLPEPFNNEELYTYFKVFSLHGQSRDAFQKSQNSNWKYDVVNAGYKANMTDILASFGLAELSRYKNDTLIKRKEIFDKYSRAFSQYEWAEIPTYKTGNKVSSFHIYPLRINGINENKRDEIIQKIFEKEVCVNVHFQPVPILSYYKEKHDIKNFPISFDNYAREISLPVYYDLTDDQIDKVIKVIIESVEELI